MSERVEPESWPYMPEDVEPLSSAPTVGSWVWFIPDRVRHSSFHEVRSIALLEDEKPSVQLVEVTCGRAWPLEYFAATVEAGDPVLARSADGTRALCGNCGAERRSGRNHWARRLEAQRRGR